MSDTPLSNASQLEILRNQYIQIENDITRDESEKLQIFKTINSISERIAKLDNDIYELNDEKSNIEQLITEITKGYTKIEASTQSLLLLTARQLKMLKRKYNN
ncbi:hypothetical protein SteCoe_31060 [Stentor coeruleus]|uniref:Uncharacterized protein n=1 Tax=Stentor coeruleus TaxID=5963 RepID=A0A1R2B266_9CILI|nr:hypothetical protein SteCoe_31060 [Stentor coeruleus]